jgi:hypothetical protein
MGTVEGDVTRATRRQLAVAYLMAALGFTYFAGSWGDGNTFSRLSLVLALVEEHRFTIDTTQTSPSWRQFETADRSYYQRHYYSDKAIGSSLVGAVAWTPVRSLLRLARVSVEPQMFTFFTTVLGVSLVCALVAPLVFAFVTSLAGPRTAAWVMAAIVFGTPIFKYSTGYYGHVQAGLLYFAAFALWFNARRRRTLPAWTAFGSGLLLGYMVVTEYPTAVLVPVLGGYMLVVLRDLGLATEWRLYAATAAGFALALTPLAYYNLHVYGALWTTGYQHHATPAFEAAHAQGLSGIGWPDPVVLFASTFHPLMGIFWQSPVLLLAIVGWFAAKDPELRDASWFSLVAVTTYLVLLSGYYDWSGGTAYSPRHLIPLYPLFAIPLACLPRRWRHLALALTAISILQHLIAVSARWDSLDTLLDAAIEDGHPTTYVASTIWSVCWVNLRSGLFLKNAGTLVWPNGGFATLAPLLVAQGALLIALLKDKTRLVRAGDHHCQLAAGD